MAVFFLYPVIYDIYISFFSYSLGGDKVFNFGQNYIRMLYDEQFLQSLVITLIYIFFCVLSQVILGIAIAMLFNIESKAIKFFRTLLLLPTVFTPLVVGLLWKALYHPDQGVITYYLREIGIQIGRGMLVERHLALMGIIIIDLWEWTPLVAIIILSGMKSLPKEPYEASMLDGAGKFDTFRYITIPLLKPTLLIAILIRTLDAMKAFDIIFATTNGGPGTSTTVANLRIYEIGVQQMKIGYAAALSNVLLFFGVLVGTIFMHIMFKNKGRSL
jgi:multiple sugar transport system permease protein